MIGAAMSTLRAFLAVALLLPGSTLVFAQALEEPFASLDMDKDGAISRVEYDAYMSGAFGTLDVNRDGRLSKDEAGRVLSPEQGVTIDADRDGWISRSEFLDQMNDDFAMADGDLDSQLR